MSRVPIPLEPHTLRKLLQLVCNETGLVVGEEMAMQEVERTGLPLPLILADVAEPTQPGILLLFNLLLLVNVRQHHQLLTHDGDLEGELGKQVGVALHHLPQVRSVGLQQPQQKPRVVLQYQQSELPQNIGYLYGFFLYLLLPHDIVLELLGEEAEVDGALHEVEETGLVDILVLLEVQLHLPRVELQLPPLEVGLEELADQLQLQRAGELLQQGVLDADEDADGFGDGQLLHPQEEGQLVEDHLEVLAWEKELDYVGGVFLALVPKFQVELPAAETQFAAELLHLPQTSHEDGFLGLVSSDG